MTAASATLPPLVVEHANLLDVAAGTYRADSWVAVEGDRIVDMGEGGQAPAVDGPRIDARGQTLLPGLIDAHVHPTLTSMDLASLGRRPLMVVAQEARQILERMLRRGFTTVRDAAGGDRGLAMAIDRGLIAGPRLLYCGRALSQTGGHGDFRPLDEHPELCACQIHTSGFSHVVDGVSAVRRAAREELRRGAHAIKVMASGGVASPSDPIWNVQFSADELRAAVEEAASWHTYVLAHAYTPEAIQRAVLAGVRSIEHGNLLDQETASLMATHGAFLVPTLVTYHKIAEFGAALGFPAVSLGKVQDVLDRGLASLELASAAGVPIGFGTDLLGETHDYQSAEFVIRADAMAPIDILRSATVVNAVLLRRDDIGIVSPGASADMLLVDGDPLDDITLLDGQGEHLTLIVRAGEIVKRA